MADVRRWLRRSLVPLGGLLLLWLGAGQPAGSPPAHRAGWLEVDGIRTRVLRAGQGDTTIVFLHGYGESVLAWRPILDRFTGGYRVLAFDLPGFGLADRPEAPYDTAWYRAWLTHLLDRETRGPVVVVGHSMGGQLAADLALARPDRVVALVLIDAAGAGLSPLLSDTGVASPAARWVGTAFSFVLPVDDPAWLSDPPSGTRGPRDAADASRLVLEHFDFAGLAGRLAELHQPVLLLWGREDPTIPFAIGERIAAQLPCRHFVPLPALHRPHQTVPDTVVAEMTRFLKAPACDPDAPSGGPRP